MSLETECLVSSSLWGSTSPVNEHFSHGHTASQRHILSSAHSKETRASSVLRKEREWGIVGSRREREKERGGEREGGEGEGERE